ncbi:MAG: Gfo/Idh/MocA family oxidoreductase [Chloroflexota bacterium]|nr:Gfo/Idh/MocA family oxidoreductase [Chloroflexota bacterium]
MTMLTVGLVAKRSGAFVTGILALPETRIVGVCDPDAGARAGLAERAGVGEAEQYADFDALLSRARPELVILGTPMQLHVPQAVQALEQGCHVLSEVTAAVDLDQCRTLVRAVRRAQRASGAQYMMAENYCYRKDVVLVRALARAGMFGDRYFGEGEYLHDVKYLHRFPDGSPTWRAEWQVGKRGCTYGTHSLGPALEFFGPEARVVTVSCVGSGVHSDSALPHDDTTLMLCQLNTGGLIKVRLDMMSNRPHAMAYYALQGTTGCYEGARGFGDQPKIWLQESVVDSVVDLGDAQGTHSPREWRSLWEYEAHLPDMWRNPSEEAVRAGHGGGDYFIVRDFVAAVRSGEAPPIDVFRALEYTVPGLISEQSIAQGGAPLPVPDFRQLEEDAAPSDAREQPMAIRAPRR